MAWVYPATKSGLTVDAVKDDHLFGLSLANGVGVDLADTTIWRQIRAAEDRLERILGLPLGRKITFDCGGLGPAGSDVIELPPLDWRRTMVEYESWFGLTLPHRPINSFEVLKLGFSASQIYMEVPDEWLRVEPRVGFVRVTPYIGTAQLYSAQFSAYVLRLGSQEQLPGLIYCRYKAGLTTTQIADDYNDMHEYLAKRALIRIFPVLSAMRNQEGSSQSESIDGLSRSRSGADQVFANLVKLYQEETDAWEAEFIRKLQGVPFTVLGL